MQMENKKRMPQQAPQAKADKAPAEQDTALVWGKNPVTELLKSGGAVTELRGVTYGMDIPEAYRTDVLRALLAQQETADVAAE